MTDAPVALLNVARYALNHAAVQLPEGEAKQRVHTALAAVSDALDVRTSDLTTERTLKHLEVIADALAAPGSGKAK